MIPAIQEIANLLEKHEGDFHLNSVEISADGYISIRVGAYYTAKTIVEVLQIKTTSEHDGGTLAFTMGKLPSGTRVSIWSDGRVENQLAELDKKREKLLEQIRDKK